MRQLPVVLTLNEAATTRSATSAGSARSSRLFCNSTGISRVSSTRSAPNGGSTASSTAT